MLHYKCIWLLLIGPLEVIPRFLPARLSVCLLVLSRKTEKNLFGAKKFLRLEELVCRFSTNEQQWICWCRAFRET